MGADHHSASVHVEASPEVVFDYFTDPAALTRWMGDRAILDPRPGGRFTVVFGDRTVEGRYVHVDRPRRLVVTWGRAGSTSLPPGSSELEVTFTPAGDGTLVSLRHSGLPHTELHRHALGWEHYLARLALVAAGADAGPHVVPPDLVEGVEDETTNPDV